MDINFYGETELFLDNFSGKFKYKIFHGHWPQHMANCPCPIDVHEIDKTQIETILNAPPNRNPQNK